MRKDSAIKTELELCNRELELHRLAQTDKSSEYILRLKGRIEALEWVLRWGL